MFYKKELFTVTSGQVVEWDTKLVNSNSAFVAVVAFVLFDPIYKDQGLSVGCPCHIIVVIIYSWERGARPGARVPTPYQATPRACPLCSGGYPASCFYLR